MTSKKPRTQKKYGRMKGGPGTMGEMTLRRRRNLIKVILQEELSPERIRGRLRKDHNIKISRWTLRRDLNAVKEEGLLQVFESIPPGEIYQEFCEDLDEDQLDLLAHIQNIEDDLKKLKPNQKSNLYNALAQLVRTRSFNRAKIITIGQALGQIPDYSNTINVNMKIEVRVQVAMELIDTMVPIVLKYIPDLKSQRICADEIDKAVGPLLQAESGGPPNSKHKKPRPGRPGRSQSGN